MVDCGKEKLVSSVKSSFKGAYICSEAMSFIEADWAKEATQLTKSNSVIARATTQNQQTKRSSFFNREDNFVCDCSEGNLVMTALFFAVIPTAPSWDLQGKESSSCFFNKEDNFAWERSEESLVMTDFFTLTPKPQTSNSFELPSHFRYYASSIGRFLKPDNTIPNAFNPQSWNLYSYVNGNPVNFNDPMGHFINPPHSTKVALAGVPDVDISGMLTPVEIYEWFGGNILYSNIPTAQQYYQTAYASAQEAAARGFHFYSPYGYTALNSFSLNQSVLMGEGAATAAPCTDQSCNEERELYVSTVVWRLRGLFKFYYPSIYSSFLNFDIHYENINDSGWIRGDFTSPRVGVKSFDLSSASAWRVEKGKIVYRQFSDVFIKVSLTILHEFAHYYLREKHEEPVVAQAYIWYVRFFGENW